MSKGGSIVYHLNEFNTVTSELSFVGLNFDDEVRNLLFLCTIPESWNGLVMAISNSVSLSITLNFDGVVSVILSKEMWWKSSSEIWGNSLTTNIRGWKTEKGAQEIIVSQEKAYPNID